MGIGMVTPLLVTKLTIPPLRGGHITRPHLLAALEKGADRKIILVAAAAGFGKTSLLAEWSAGKQTAWLSLESSENDPIRFLSYLIASIQTCYPTFGQEISSALQSPQPPAIEPILSSFINQLATVPQRFFVVLDDYHLIENPQVHDILTFFIEHLPAQVSIILLSRVDPPLPLARWRAKNTLFELRADVLRFSLSEIAEFLGRDFQLPPESIQALEARTEGWAAGLQLAALAMHTYTGDKQQFIQEFTGSHRFVLDYLLEEVLVQQPIHIRQFLLQTSILNQLHGGLCEAITGENFLENLEKNNLFVIPLDQSREWYRYHHLFADLLKARLQAEMPEKIPTLYQKAASWYAAHGLAEEAVGAALNAHDFAYAADLILGVAQAVSYRGEVFTLIAWYRAFPPGFVATQPRLSLYFGMAFALNGRWEEAEVLLAIVEESPILPQEALLLAYLVANYRQDSQKLATLAMQAEQQKGKVASLVLGLLASVHGDFKAACEWMEDTYIASQHEGDETLALTALFHQCRFQVFYGNLRQAHDLCKQALTQTRLSLPMATLAHVSLMRIFIEWNELDQATHHGEQARRLAEASGFVTGILSSTTMMQAEIFQAQGQTDLAQTTAQTAIRHAERYDPPLEVAWLKIYWVRLGNFQMADWQPRSPSIFYPPAIHPVTQARVLLAQRQTQQAIHILTQWTNQPRHLLTVEIFALLALARQQQGDTVHAMLALAQALELAEAENRLRVFLELDAPMAALLGQFVETYPKHAFAQKLRGMFPEKNASRVSDLNERELEILRLIAAGYSNEEIAQQLVLAVSTVKWYINTLYSKLQVKTRSQAIARAHEHRLLAD